MSEVPRMNDSAHMIVSASERVERNAPQWLAEVAVYAQVWVQSGLLEKLKERVHVPRGRMGSYVECDFVLPALGYASSAEHTLKDFYSRLEGFESALPALWGRKAMPSRAALSRFHAAVTPEALESFRALLSEDLLERGISEAQCGGLVDRVGQRHVFFDIDGTKQPGRQRTLVSGEEYPAPRRRLAELCAPARLGRKRGEVGRTRSVVQQAHTSELLGSFGGAENGQMHAELKIGCAAVRAYTERRHLEPSAAVVRLDGLYGYVPSILIPAELGLGRGAAEGLLGAEDRELQTDRLVSTRPCGQEWWQLISQWVWNERLRIGAVAIGAVARRTLWAEPRSGLPQLVSFGEALVDASFSAPAQQTEQQPAAEVAGQVEQRPPAQQLPEVQATRRTEQPTFTCLHEPTPAPFGTVAAACGRGAGRFAAEDFQWLDPHTLLCPAGKPLRPRERRIRQQRVLFEARAADCRSCALAAQCLGGKSSITRGRRVSVIPSDSERPAAAAAPPSETHPSHLPQPPAPGLTPPQPNLVSAQQQFLFFYKYGIMSGCPPKR